MKKPGVSFSLRRWVVLGAVGGLVLAPPVLSQQRLLVCGQSLVAAADAVPSGLPSLRCSEIKSFGEGVLADPQAALRVEPSALLKGPDANSIRFREAALERASLGTLTFHLLAGSIAAPLEVMRVELEGSVVRTITTGASKAEPVENVTIAASRLRWSVWAPAATPGTSPTATYCWDLLAGGSC